MQLKMVNDCLLIKVPKEREELGNGMSVSARNTERRKIIKGIIVHSSMEEYKEGLEIYFPLYAGDSISIDGENLYLINANDVKIIIR